MYSGKMIQELEIGQLKSERRNPIIADLFHRMKYMERRGSGLEKIINETKKLPGYAEQFLPGFYSSISSFTVVLKNVNYTSKQSDDVGLGVGLNVGLSVGINETQKKIIDIIISNPDVKAQELADALGITRRRVESNIRKLKAIGLIESEGAKKNGRWIVSTDIKGD
jgi:ATP-dependent DNA helicase RecG